MRVPAFSPRGTRFHNSTVTTTIPDSGITALALPFFCKHPSVEYEKRIKEVRAQIDTLDASLNSQRTPGMKAQLQFARHLLDDAEAALRHAKEEDSTSHDTAMWHAFAGFSIQHSTQIRDTIQKTVETYGGPANVLEVGGEN